MYTVEEAVHEIGFGVFQILLSIFCGLIWVIIPAYYIHTYVCIYMYKVVVGGLAMAGLVFGNGIKLTSSIKSINFQIYSFCSFVDFEINSARLEFILSLSSLIVG